ncbi:MAG: DMT family transporter [Steroidobacteraceae bacterium]
MSSLGLYSIAVLIWGSTWLAIKFQLGVVPPTVSVVWRFALAGLLLLAFAAVRRRALRFSAREHRWIALQGALLFGFNYVGVYLAEQYLTSGLVAIVYSVVVFLNALGLWMFFGQPIRSSTLLAAAVGVTGVALVFWPEMLRFASQREQYAGLGWAIGSTVVCALGNMVATRNHRHALPVLQVNAWSMLYGAALVALLAFATGQKFVFQASWPYVASLLYLAVLGSAVAFGAYLTLMRRIGADRAAFTAVAIPVVALLLSTAFEQLQWRLATFAGIGLCVVGNVLILRRPMA